jgi:hypothetical protein
MLTHNRRPRIKLRSLRKARVLLILTCNAAACTGNYFRAETYTKKGWNAWKEADACLRDLRNEGLLAFAAMDSSTLDTEPNGSKGAIVFETEMYRAKNPTGKDWGAPNWRWFRPSKSGKCEYLEALTDSMVKGIRRVEKMGFSQVFVLVNPRGYFLSLAAAVDKCGLLNKWVLFRVPSHPRHLIPAIRQISPIVRVAAGEAKLKGGIYPIPALYPFMKEEDRIYKDSLPKPWRKYSKLSGINDVNSQWLSLASAAKI